MAVHADLLVEVAFVDVSFVEENQAHFLEGCPGFRSKKKKKKETVISHPEVILPSLRGQYHFQKWCCPNRGP